MPDRVWAEINLNNIEHNISQIRRITGPGVKIMAVVKADAYGHGAEDFSRYLLSIGVDRLAVACVDEALQLKNAGIAAPIHILSRTDESRVREVIENNFIQTVSDSDMAFALASKAKELKKRAVIHIKFDTGMGRLGFLCSKNSLDEVNKIIDEPVLETEGIATHFSSADEDDCEYTEMQYKLFSEMCEAVVKMGIKTPIRHASNSAAIFNHPHMCLDMVRPGAALYGIYTGASKFPDKNIQLPVLSLKARVIGIKRMDAGSFIGYGKSYRVDSDSLIAVISAGYADGYPRALSNKGSVLINGEAAPIIGNVCMDHCMADVTRLKNEIKIGQEAALITGDCDERFNIPGIVKTTGWISHEIACGIGRRVPKIYTRPEKRD